VIAFIVISWPVPKTHTSHADKRWFLTMTRILLYQIAYSDETWNAVPKNFFALDNRANQRPDWAEYWSIRRFLQNEVLDENAFYGFVSPRLTEKLLCTPNEIFEFVASVSDDVEVAAFSPFIDFRSMFLNVFEQGEFFHPGHMDLSQRVIQEIMPGKNLRELINTSANAIFCNYFAAKPRFWRKWLTLSERVFAMAESPEHPLFLALTRAQAHRGANQAKVFIIERLASLLLATTSDFKLAVFKETTLSNVFLDLSPELLDCLNTLKSLGAKGQLTLLKAFYQIQHEILSGESAKNERKRLISQSLEHGVVHAPSKGYEHWGSAPTAFLYAQGQINLWQYIRRIAWQRKAL
jgi:hypothetical protein